MPRSNGATPLLRGCVAAIAAGLIGVLLLVPAGVFGVWQGAVEPPWFEQRLGGLTIVGYRTWNANCPPFAGCDPSLRESYVVWVVGEPNGQQATGATRLLRVPIEHEH